MRYSARLVEAFSFAHDLHKDQERKASGAPYITHLMGVAAIVGRHGGTEDQVIAALLHDAVEDQGGAATLERIRERFGETVAAYVDGCSDTDTKPKPPWEERKREFLEGTVDAPPDLKLIVAADKLHNARTLANTLRVQGNAAWDLFRGGRDGTLWYFAEIVRALATGWSHPVLHELAEAVDALHRAASQLNGVP